MYIEGKYAMVNLKQLESFTDTFYTPISFLNYEH